MRFAFGFVVGNDMGCVEQFFVTQAAERTLPLVRLEYSLAECSLMQAHSYYGRNIRPPSYIGNRFVSRPDRQPYVCCIVYGDSERKIARVILDDEHWPSHKVFSGNDAMFVNQWKPPLHREPQPAIIDVARVGASVPITKQPVRAKGVIIRPTRRCGDGQRHLMHYAGLEDALRPQQRDSLTVYAEAFGENGPRKHIAV
jgi:hypothetical protein